MSIYIYFMLATGTSGSMIYFVLDVAWKGIYECAAIIFLMEFGKKYFNKKSSLLSYFSKASFTYYIIHFVPVSIFTYLLIGTSWNVYVKYLIVTALSYVCMFAAYELAVRRLAPVLKQAFYQYGSEDKKIENNGGKTA